MSSFYVERAERDAELGITSDTREELEGLFLRDPRCNTVAGYAAFFEIAAKHLAPDERFYPTAEHEIIYWPLTAKQVPEDSEDGRLLIGLGFHVDYEADENGCWADFT